MSNPWRAQVNQKLYFSQLLLSEADDESGQAQIALLQGAVFHLATAYRLYLKEVAQYQRQMTDAVDARSARKQFMAKDWSCQELDVLARLEEEGQWPARLQRAMRETEGAEIQAKPAEAPVGIIAVADITEVVDVAACQQWLTQFQQLIEIQRDAVQEC
jgi:hypothetical protein